MPSERKAILERYAWDRTQDEEELLIRAMMYHNPVELLMGRCQLLASIDWDG
jgi:hypothetical protein